MPHLFPAVGTVHGGCLVKRRVNSDHGCVIKDTAVSETFPKVYKHQDERPVFGSGIPAHRIFSKRYQNLVQEAVLLAQEAKHDVGNDYHGDQIRNQNHSLVDFFVQCTAHEVQHNCHGYCQHISKKDKGQIVTDGVPDDVLGILRFKKISKVA